MAQADGVLGDRPGDDGAQTRLLRLRLDEQGRHDLVRLLSDLADELTEIEAESAGRLAGAPRARVYESRLSIVPFFDAPAP